MLAIHERFISLSLEQHIFKINIVGQSGVLIPVEVVIPSEQIPKPPARGIGELKRLQRNKQRKR